MASGDEVTDPALLAALNGSQPAAIPGEVTDPALLARLNGQPATASDRVQAAGAGLKRGIAQLAGAIPDVGANAVYDLWKHPFQGANYQPPFDPYPTTRALTKLMDQSPVTTTQPTRPDDAVSRYTATGASVIPGAVAGGGSLGGLVRGLTSGIPASAAGQYVDEKQPFQSPTANRVASVGAQLLAGALAPGGRVAGAPKAGQEVAARTVQDAQNAGFTIPPALTNPTGTNRLLNWWAGKPDVKAESSLENAEQLSTGARSDLNLPGHGPVTEADADKIKTATAGTYNAVRQAPPVSFDGTLHNQLVAALSKDSGASNVSPALGNTGLRDVLQPIIAKSDPTKTGLAAQVGRIHDTGDVLDTIDTIRDRAKTAFRAGDAGIGSAYWDSQKALEAQLDRGLTANGQPDLMQQFKDARQRRAILGTVQDVQNPGTLSMNGQKLAAALRDGAPLSGNLKIAARAAAAAPEAFTPVERLPGNSGHGFWPSMIAAGAVAGEGAGHFAGWPGYALAAIPPSVATSKWLTRKYLLGPGQQSALPTKQAFNPSLLGGVYTSQGVGQ